MISITNYWTNLLPLFTNVTTNSYPNQYLNLINGLASLKNRVFKYFLQDLLTHKLNPSLLSLLALSIISFVIIMTKSTKKNEKKQPQPTKRKASSSSSAGSRSVSKPKPPKQPKKGKEKKSDAPTSPPPNCNPAPPPCVPNEPGITSRIIPDKPLSDTNEYRIIKLTNGLTVLLMSRCDPEDATGASDNESKSSPKAKLKQPGKRTQIRHRYSIPLMPTAQLKSCKADPTTPPEEEVSSVALVVSAGAFKDPEPFQGLAHFIEHTVYLGSEQFPREDVFEFEIGTFAIYFNATTTNSITQYYSEISNLLFEKNLEIMADMIAKPLFREQLLDKEILSLDCEFYRKLHIWHAFAFLPSFVIRSKGHPFGKMVCGNLETLNTRDKQTLCRIKAAMQEYHTKFYRASAMTLCLNSTKSLDELEGLVLKYFSRLVPGDRQLIHSEKDGKTPELESVFGDNGGKCGTENENSHFYYYIQGNSCRSTLQLTWALDTSCQHLSNPQHKVPDLISSLFSFSIKKGLDAHLRQEGLILEMNVDVDSFESFKTTMVNLTLNLSAAGRKCTLEIISKVRTYLEVLSGESLGFDNKSRWEIHFEELRVQQLRSFHYDGQDSSLDYTLKCANLLQNRKDSKKMFSSDSWIDAEFNNDSVKEGFKQMLDPNRLVIIETLPKKVKLEDILRNEKTHSKSTKTAAAAFQIEIDKITKVKYLKTTKIIPPSNNHIRLFEFPPRNFFIKYFTPKTKIGVGDCAKVIPAPPPNFGDINTQTLEWKSRMDPPGTQFMKKISGRHEGHYGISDNRYRAGIEISFLSFFSRSRMPRTSALALIWAKVIENKVRSRKDEFFLAGCEFEVTAGMEINVFGFPSIALIDLVDTIIEAMFEEEITQREFYLAKECISIRFETLEAEEIIDGIIYTLTDPFVTSYPDSFDLHGVIQDLTLTDLIRTIEAFKMCSACKVSLVGNLPLHSFKIVAGILEYADFGPRLDNDPKLFPPLKYTHGIYEPGEKCIRIKNLNSSSYLTTVTNYYVVPIENFHEIVYFDVAMNFMNMFSFNYLRTHCQLGYDVFSEPYYVLPKGGEDVVCFAVTVSPIAKSFTTCTVNSKIDEFLSQYGNQIKKMPNRYFETYKKMNPLYEEIEQEEVGDWFNSKFGPEFNTEAFGKNKGLDKCKLAGMQKVSLQVLTGNPDAGTKPCCCRICADIVGWVPGKAHKSTLIYAKGQGAARDYFVDSALT